MMTIDEIDRELLIVVANMTTAEKVELLGILTEHLNDLKLMIHFDDPKNHPENYDQQT